ncbi:MAG: sigma-70 family RNA polymerase sigma factor [Frankia sp.]|nr:sigma-70 family RNA polymerase sigma factor [Frankia sp.]
MDQHRDEVYRFLVAVVGRQDADDCFQETWLAALRAYPTLRDASNLRGWVFTIAQRKALDEHRAAARRPTPHADPANGARSSVAPDAGLPEPTLWRDVRALPDKQCIAVAHRYVNDLDYAEIGALMGTSAEAARRNVHEGIRKLRLTWQE